MDARSLLAEMAARVSTRSMPGGTPRADGGRMDCVDPEHKLTTLAIDLALLELCAEALKQLLDHVPRTTDVPPLEETPPDAGSLAF